MENTLENLTREQLLVLLVKQERKGNKAMTACQNLIEHWKTIGDEREDIDLKTVRKHFAEESRYVAG